MHRSFENDQASQDAIMLVEGGCFLFVDGRTNKQHRLQHWLLHSERKHLFPPFALPEMLAVGGPPNGSAALCTSVAVTSHFDNYCPQTAMTPSRRGRARPGPARRRPTPLPQREAAPGWPGPPSVCQCH